MSWGFNWNQSCVYSTSMTELLGAVWSLKHDLEVVERLGAQIGQQLKSENRDRLMS